MNVFELRIDTGKIPSESILYATRTCARHAAFSSRAEGSEIVLSVSSKENAAEFISEFSQSLLAGASEADPVPLSASQMKKLNNEINGIVLDYQISEILSGQV